MREGRWGWIVGMMVLLVVVLRGLAWSSSASAAGAAPLLQAEASYKVVTAPGALEGVEGARLVAEYGTYSLYTITGAALGQLDPARRAQVTLAGEMDHLLLANLPFDTRAGLPRVPDRLLADPNAASNLHLVQFVGPIKSEWLRTVEASGATLVHYIANNGYLVWADAGTSARLSEMARSGEMLQFSTLYHPLFKLAQQLQRQGVPTEKEGAAIPVVVQMLRHPGRADTEKAIRALAVEVLSDWSPVLEYQNMTLLVRPGDIEALARFPDVVWVGARHERERLDEVQDQILAGALNAGRTGPTGPGYLAWLDELGFSQDPNDYPIVDIVDDGVGSGTVITGDTTFHRFGDSTLATRMAYVTNCSLANDGGGPDGHGHINASIMAGYDARTGAPYRDEEGFQRGLGVNPYGRLASTRVFNGLDFEITECGGTDAGLIRASYKSGARILSNSWGCGNCLGYDESAQAYDVGVRDADLTVAGNQEVIAIFAAGNTGPFTTTIGSPSNAKNVITVGASENDRPTWLDGCLSGAPDADDAMDIAGFSSRGPAIGGRTKPEVVAPGTHIQGTASTHPMYNGSGVCDAHMPSNQTIFAASSGTSHSAPAVSGVAALYYYWLGEHYDLTAPSMAMMKAYLIGHPTYLTGTDANDSLPSNTQGYGMPNMSLAFDDANRVLLDQSVRLEESGEEWSIRMTVVDPTRPVRIVLAYTDQAGALGANPQVNDLNLIARLDGTTYRGNLFGGQWSTPGGTPDTANNYEAIFLPAGTEGTLDVTVLGFNIAGDGVPNVGDSTDQDFAFLCYNCAQFPDFRLDPAEPSAAICAPDPATYQLQLGSIMEYDESVTLRLLTPITGTTSSLSPNPATPPGTATLRITPGNQAVPGHYDLTVEGKSVSHTHTTTLSLDLFTAIPVRSTLLTPAMNAAEQSQMPTFSWSPVAQALSYELEVARDPAFEEIIYRAPDLTESSHTPIQPLPTSQILYWRVRASNACGTGATSAAFTFSTLAAPGECGVGARPVTLFNENFESGSDTWISGGIQNEQVISDTWRLSTARTHSGTSAILVPGIEAASDRYLISPPVTLPAGQSLYTLHFWNYQAIEKARTTSGICYDGAILEISADNGTTWDSLAPGNLLTDPYDGMISSSFQNPLGGLQAWCGNPQDWLESIVNVERYAGKSVRFRFRMGSDEGTAREGWYVDDVKVQYCVAESKSLYLPLMTGGK